jgi:hypothetical protein
MRRSILRKASLGFTVIVLLLPGIAGLLLFLGARNGIVSGDEVNLALNIASLSFAVYISLFTGYLSWRALVFAAVPRIDIEYLGDEKTGSTDLFTNEKSSIRFQVSNVGWWYARPASTNTEFFLNFGPEFSLKRARYGSQLELVQETIHPGKANGHYFWVTGIHLYHGEAPEEIAVDLTTPKQAGQYVCRISAFSEQTTYGVFPFVINVVSNPKKRQKASTTHK